MPDIPYAIVDVFSDAPLAGNPLAVVTDADELSVERLAAIAVEFNLSETTFVTAPSLPGADWALRSFTPSGDEVTGAGHNALGAWWWLAHTGRAQAPSAHQELGGRVLPVGIGADEPRTITLAQGPAELTACEIDRARLAEVLGVTGPSAFDDDLPLGCGSVGSVHLLVPFANAGEVDALAPDAAGLRDVLRAVGAQGCYTYTADSGKDGVDVHARFFNPTVGIAEDPATGSAAGPLAAHLAAVGRIDDELTVLQGEKMGRPSTVRIELAAGGPRLSGRCALSATGRLHL